MIRSLNLVFGCVKLTSLSKRKQNKKTNRKITLRIKWQKNSYVLIFSHVGRRNEITSKGKVAAFACSVFTTTYCISVISKASNGVNSFLKELTSVKRILVGLSRLCSATFEQLLAFGATFCGFSNLEQVLPFRAIFEQNIGLEHISSTKKSTISWKTSIHANFLKAYHVINLLNT